MVGGHSGDYSGSADLHRPVPQPTPAHHEPLRGLDAVSASTIYAKRHRGVRALVDGQELRLRESNARSIYSSLAALGVGHFTDRLPEGEPDATLYYSDTSVMRLWRYPLKRSSSGRWEGVFISFVSLDGTPYSYYTDRTDWQNISWPLSPESNAPWSN